MEIQSRHASHALALADYIGCQYSREMLEGMIMIVVEQDRIREMMLERMGQVCHMGTPLIFDLSANVLPAPICSISEDAATLTVLCVAAQGSQRNAH